MNTNSRKLAAGLAAVALLAAGPIAAADARGGGGGGGGGGGQVQPRPVQQPPQLPQLPPSFPQLPGLPQLPPPTNQPEPQPGDVAQVKVLRLLHSCRGNLPLARGAMEYEVFPLSGATLLSVEIDNGPPNTPVTFTVDTTTFGPLTTDVFGDAKWIDTSGALVPTVTSLVQISDAKGVVVGTAC